MPSIFDSTREAIDVGAMYTQLRAKRELQEAETFIQAESLKLSQELMTNPETQTWMGTFEERMADIHREASSRIMFAGEEFKSLFKSSYEGMKNQVYTQAYNKEMDLNMKLVENKSKMLIEQGDYAGLERLSTEYASVFGQRQMELMKGVWMEMAENTGVAKMYQQAVQEEDAKPGFYNKWRTDISGMESIDVNGRKVLLTPGRKEAILKEADDYYRDFETQVQIQWNRENDTVMSSTMTKIFNGQITNVNQITPLTRMARRAGRITDSQYSALVGLLEKTSASTSPNDKAIADEYFNKFQHTFISQGLGVTSEVLDENLERARAQVIAELSKDPRYKDRAEAISYMVYGQLYAKKDAFRDVANVFKKPLDDYYTVYKKEYEKSPGLFESDANQFVQSMMYSWKFGDDPEEWRKKFSSMRPEEIEKGMNAIREARINEQYNLAQVLVEKSPIGNGRYFTKLHSDIEKFDQDLARGEFEYGSLDRGLRAIAQNGAFGNYMTMTPQKLGEAVRDRNVFNFFANLRAKSDYVTTIAGKPHEWVANENKRGIVDGSARFRYGNTWYEMKYAPSGGLGQWTEDKYKIGVYNLIQNPSTGQMDEVWVPFEGSPQDVQDQFRKSVNQSISNANQRRPAPNTATRGSQQ